MSSLRTGSILRITLLYVGIGSLWVLLSDLALGHLMAAPRLLTYLELLKGAAFVVTTALLLHFSLRQELQKLNRRSEQIPDVEERLRLLTTAVEAAANGIVITDRDGRIIWVNPAFTRLTGYGAEEALGQNLRLLKSGRHHHAFYQNLWESVLAGRVWRGEITNRKKDGSLFTDEQTIAPVQTAAGAVTHFISINHNITERRDAERALATRTQQLEAVRAVSTEITRELNVQTVLDLIVRRAVELTRADSGMVHFWDAQGVHLVPQSTLGVTPERLGVTLAPGEGVAGTVAATRRGLLVNDFRGSPYATPALVAVTPHNRVLGEPLEFRDRCIGAITVSRATDEPEFTEAEQGTLRLLAVQAAIAIENARLFAAAERTAREARSLYEVAHRLTTSLDLVEVLRLIAEKTTELLGTPHAQVVLWDEATQTLRLGAAHGTDAEHVREQDFRVGVGVNGIVAQTRAPLVVNDYQSFPQRVPELSHLVADMAVPLLYQGRLLGVLDTHTTQPGAVFTEEHLALLSSFATQAAIAIENARLFAEAEQAMEDIHLAQAELVRAETLRALGQMAAGIAHDLNNTFAAILGQVQLRKLRAADAPAQEWLALLEIAAMDGAQIVQRLLNFARPRGASRLGSVDLAATVRDAVELTRPRWTDEPGRHGVAVQVALDLPAGLPLLLGNAWELREAITNLIFNAVDAMPQGGTLTLTARAENDGVVLTVQDTGIGMPPEVQARLFEPFFTTKGLRGTGLGLAAVYGIMERHGGRVTVRSAVGQGTTITLTFRRAQGPRSAPAELQARPVPSRRILVVDDEPVVRTALVAILRAAGHTVTEAADGPTAIRLLAEAPPDIVLTDLSMPELSGWEVAWAAKAQRPHLPVVLLTGWGEDAGTGEKRGLVDRVLGKPVRLADLFATIAELTAQRDEGATESDPTSGPSSSD